MEITISEADIDGLITKLAGLDLNDKEQAILSGLITRAAAAGDGEVEGFAYEREVASLDKASPKIAIIGALRLGTANRSNAGNAGNALTENVTLNYEEIKWT